MKKPPKHLLIIGSTMLVWGAFLVPNAFADAPNIVVAQGQVGSTTPVVDGSAVYNYFVGSGYSGAISSVIVSLDATRYNGTVPNYSGILVDIASSGGGDCKYNSSGATVNSTVSGFQSLTFYSEASGGCTLQPTQTITISINSSVNGSGTMTLYGATVLNTSWTANETGSATAGFYPMFDVLGPGWSFVASTSDSGYNLSGAQAYCDGVFASTTAFGLPYGGCVIAGFLFIPSSDSVQQFLGIPSLLAGTFPFSYVVQMRSILAGASASSTDNFVSISTAVGTTTSSFYIANAPLISTSSVATYFPGFEPIRQTIKSILGVGFWLIGAFAIYRTIMRIFEYA